jgi:ATP-dependent helicase HrpB
LVHQQSQSQNRLEHWTRDGFCFGGTMRDVSVDLFTSDLPVLEILPELRDVLELHRLVILTAPPGAGKSTLVPLGLLREPWLAGVGSTEVGLTEVGSVHSGIVMLQPRRLAARAVASRMAAQLAEPVGRTVGYQVRLERKTSKDTRLEVVTEGILTRRLQSDPTLEGVGLVIFDEFHERSLHADTALALIREVQAALRDDLRVLVMSATLDAENLSRMLGDAPVVSSAGRAFPVEIKYAPRDPEDTIRAVVSTVRRALEDHAGDLLVFLPGAAEINRVERMLDDLEPDGLSGVSIRPLYGDLPLEAQQAAIMPGPTRRVVLATNIAETSLTIEGVRVVIDSGLARASRFDQGSGFTKLETVRITRDSADQRAGRAGRVAPGICYRLWNESTHAGMIAQRNPEILEADLAPFALELAAWGSSGTDLEWVTPPPAMAMKQARGLLTNLQALEPNQTIGNITPHGRAMHALGTHPRLAHLLLEGKRLGFAALACDLAALLEERDPLPREAGADAMLRLEALRSWRMNQGSSGASTNALKRIDQLAASYRSKLEVQANQGLLEPLTVGRLIALAYPERIAQQRTGARERYRLASGRGVKLPSQDVLSNDSWLAVAHLDAGSDEGRIFLAAPIDPRDVISESRDVIAWDARTGTLMAQREQRIGELVLDSKPLVNIPEQTRAKALCEAIRREGLEVLPWTDQTRQIQARAASLRVWRSDDDLPDLSDAALTETLENWLAPFLTGIRKRDDFAKLDLETALKSALNYQQAQRLETLAPSKIHVPSGSNIKLEYAMDGGTPVLAVRLQEVFGLLETPTINEARTRVLLHLLSPAYRPVQVTQDLRSFWQNTYPNVRKELGRRYPKHSWPENPWTAQAVRGAVKRLRKD